MNDFKTLHDSTPQAHKNNVHPTSINLDVMLKHDERNRRSPIPNRFDNVRSSTSFQSSGSPVFSNGLPPPPRRNGKGLGGSRSSSLHVRDANSVGSGSTRSSDATDPLFPFSVSAALQPPISDPFINAVPLLTRDVGTNDQDPGSSMYSPTAPGMPNSFQLASDHDVDPLETDHDLFISFRSRRTPTSTAYSMPRMERVAGKGQGFSGQTDPQLNSKKEEFSATVAGRFFKFPENGSSVLCEYHISIVCSSLFLTKL
jgi:hypothetical protein